MREPHREIVETHWKMEETLGKIVQPHQKMEETHREMKGTLF